MVFTTFLNCLPRGLPKNMSLKHCATFLFLILLGLAACSSGPRPKKSGQAPGQDNTTLQHLITDYSSMKEQPLVSFAWIDANFQLADCAGAEMQTVANYSDKEYPPAQARIQEKLGQALAKKAASASGQQVIVSVAITGMQGKPGLIKRFSLSYEDTPYIEIEMLMAEAGSRRELVRLSHMARGEDFGQAMDRLLSDITEFINKKL